MADTVGFATTVTENWQLELENVSPFWLLTTTFTAKFTELAVTVTCVTFTELLVIVAASAGTIDQV